MDSDSHITPMNTTTSGETCKDSKTTVYQIECEDEPQKEIVQFNAFLFDQCGTLRNILEDIPNLDKDTPLPVPCSKAVGKFIIEYARLQEEFDPLATKASAKEKHENQAGAKTIVFTAWEEKVIESTLIGTNKDDQYQKDYLIFQVLKTANFLEYYDLLHFAAKAIATIIRGNNEDEIRRRFCVRPIPT